MRQVNVVRRGLEHVSDGGSVRLESMGPDPSRRIPAAQVAKSYVTRAEGGHDG